MKALFSALLLMFAAPVFCQVGMPFKEAREKGIFPKVDSIYRSAIDSDVSKAVFKTEEDVQKHIAAYQDFLLQFGQFLADNKFVWDENTRCFNRIYIAQDGTIEYFLYDFKTPLAENKVIEFRRLLNLFIKANKFGITAPEKFAQCSPVTYPKSG